MQMGISKWTGVMALGADYSDDPVQPTPTSVAAEVEVSPGAVTLTELHRSHSRPQFIVGS